MEIAECSDISKNPLVKVEYNLGKLGCIETRRGLGRNELSYVGVHGGRPYLHALLYLRVGDGAPVARAEASARSGETLIKRRKIEGE